MLTLGYFCVLCYHIVWGYWFSKLAVLVALIQCKVPRCAFVTYSFLYDIFNLKICRTKICIHLSWNYPYYAWFVFVWLFFLASLFFHCILVYCNYNLIIQIIIIIIIFCWLLMMSPFIVHLSLYIPSNECLGFCFFIKYLITNPSHGVDSIGLGQFRG